MTRSAERRLAGVLAEARRRSLVGNLPLARQIADSEGFAVAVSLEPFDGPALDLGAGGGLPGLVLAVRDPELHLVLLDSARRSSDFLRWAVAELDLSPRVEVLTTRAEEAGRNERYRETFAVVVARGFAAPAVTAECAAPLLQVGGRLIVSEPPAGRFDGDGPELDQLADRWPAQGCAVVGLVPELVLREEFGYAVLRQATVCPQRYPRRPGIPAKRPLFSGSGP